MNDCKDCPVIERTGYQGKRSHLVRVLGPGQHLCFRAETPGLRAGIRSTANQCRWQGYGVFITNRCGADVVRVKRLR